MFRHTNYILYCEGKIGGRGGPDFKMCLPLHYVEAAFVLCNSTCVQRLGQAVPVICIYGDSLAGGKKKKKDNMQMYIWNKSQGLYFISIWGDGGEVPD